MSAERRKSVRRVASLAVAGLSVLSWTLFDAIAAPGEKTVRLRHIREKPYLYDVVKSALYDSNPLKFDEWGELLEIDYRVFVAEVDLDDDGVKEIIVQFPRICRTRGCFMFVLKKIKGRWTEVCSLLDSETPRWVILSERDHGQRQIRTSAADGGNHADGAGNHSLVIRWLPDGHCEPVPNSTMGARPNDGH